MNRKTRFFGTLAVTALFGIAAVAASINHKEDKAEATSISLVTDIKSDWDYLNEHGSAPDQYGQFSINPSYTGHFYQNSVESSYYTWTLYKGAHTPTIRNYNNQNNKYFAQLSYCNEEGQNPCYILIKKGENVNFKIESIVVKLDNTIYPVIKFASTWSYSDLDSFSWNGSTGTCTPETYKDDAIIAHAGTSSTPRITSITLNLVSTTNTHLLTFDSQGGSYVPEQYVSSTAVTSEPDDPVKETVGTTAYEFDGWWTTEDDSGELFTFGEALTEDTTVYAHWVEAEAAEYTMTFDTDGGSSVASITTLQGTSFTKPVTVPTKTHSRPDKYHYVFDDWYADSLLSEKYNWNSLATGNITVYAKYNEIVNDLPSGVVNHDLAGVVGDQNIGKANYWDNTSISNSKNYFEVDLDSYDTFDKAHALPRINLTVVKSHKDGGIDYLNTSYRNNPVLRLARATISTLEEHKVITYVRVEMIAYGSNSDTAHLYANDSAMPSDTEAAPYSGWQQTRYLQASFSASDKVTSIGIGIGETGEYCQIKVRNVYIMYADDPVYTEAVGYAEDFNDANVCGTSDDDGVDDVKWGLQEEAYLALSPEARSYLTNYDGSNAEILECLERYDMAVSKHGVDYDFMGRIEAGKISAYEPIINPLTKADMSDTFALIAVITLTVLSIGAGFALYKKKSNNQ